MAIVAQVSDLAPRSLVLLLIGMFCLKEAINVYQSAIVCTTRILECSCTRYCKITRSSTSCTGPNHGNQTVKMVINFLLSNQTIAVNVTGKVLPLQITCEFSEQDFCNGTCRNDVSSSLPGCLSTQNTVFSTEPETTQGVTSALTEKTNEATSRGEILETSSTSLPFMTSSTHGITNTTLSQENTSSKTTSAVNIVTITQARSSQETVPWYSQYTP